MKILLFLTLVVAATADVSHLFSASNNLQDDGYHYSKPSDGAAVLDIPAASASYQEESSIPLPIVSFLGNSLASLASVPVPVASGPVAPLFSTGSSHHVVASAPVVSHHHHESLASASAPAFVQTSASEKVESGYNYEIPKIPFESKPAPPAPVKEYLPPPAVVKSKPKPSPVPATIPPIVYVPPAPTNKPAPPVRPPPPPPAPPAPPSPPKVYLPPKPTNKPAPPVRPQTTPASPPPPPPPQKEYLPPSSEPKGYSYPNDPQPPFRS